MNIQKGDIIQLTSGRICMVVEPLPNSAHLKCSEVWCDEIFFPLTVRVKKVLRRFAEIKRTRNKQFRFNLIGDNGEIIGTSETYRTKAKAIKTVKTYHPTFKIVDKT